MTNNEKTVLEKLVDELRAELSTTQLNCDLWHDRAEDMRNRLSETQAENAKLRELVRDYIDAPCTTCDCWQDNFRCWNYDGADCGLVARARELGVEME